MEKINAMNCNVLRYFSVLANVEHYNPEAALDLAPRCGNLWNSSSALSGKRIFPEKNKKVLARV